MAQQQDQSYPLSKYSIIEPIPTPVMIAQIEDQTKYKFPITIVQQKFASAVHEPVNDILIRITPHKSDYCLN